MTQEGGMTNECVSRRQEDEYMTHKKLHQEGSQNNVAMNALLPLPVIPVVTPRHRPKRS
jgi:hypothetical protein